MPARLPWTRRHPGALTVPVFLVLLALRPAPSGAQSWKQVNAFGYGGAGATVGVLLLLDHDCTDEGLGCLAGRTILSPLAGAVGALVGGTAGAAIGGSADSAVERGQPLGPVHRGAVAAGTIFAGATAGASAAGLLYRAGWDPTREHVGKTVAVLGSTGAILALVYLEKRWGELTGGRPGVGGPVFDLSPWFSDAPGSGIRLRVRF